MSANVVESYRVILGDWTACGKEAAAIRRQVFVLEQLVPIEEEMDEKDALCVHALAYSVDGTPVGTGRLLPDGHIGRMAVLQAHRGHGVGSLLLNKLIDEARRRGHLQVALAAQTHAQAFYASHGFLAEGPVFLDAGIDHVHMRRVLTA